MKQLTTRQAKLIMLFYVCISKIMLLPSLICGKVKQDYFVVISAMFLFELLFLLLILSISSKNPNKTFKQLFEEKYGKIVTKIFYFLIGTLLLLKTCLLLHETFIYLYESLYVDFKWWFMLFPSSIYAVYMSSRHLKTFGRTIEIFCYVILGCVVIAWFDAIGNIKMLNWLPFFTSDANVIVSSCFKSSIWFGDFLILFFIIGNVKVEKKTNKEIVKGWIYGVIIAVVTFVLFYGVFGTTSSLKRMALLDITQYAPKLSATGNFIWLVNILWPVILFYVLAFLTFLTTQSYSYCFNSKHNYRFMLSVIVVIATILILLLFDLRITNLVNFISGWFNVVIFIVQYVLAFVMLVVLTIPFERKKEAKYVN